ncbi:engulfment and cell motility ELM family protein [Trypanosoma theileri]|uniref:Engulfment and cell motility ELM family protein n=1 Tax=Trypanosoma theileri TaxID=67003 RepID=A0A1X0P7Q3_9TRYP|nr:engulfment and cell motility ELM family protein [Trypanosoma theileri]ORC92875.1 engulfment and cell motility ELM family protein [Trypanosoma theileri]
MWFSSRNIQSDVAVALVIVGVAGVITVLYHRSHKSRTGGWIPSLPSSLSSLTSLLLPSSLLSLSSRRRRRPVRLVISANQRPELATRQAITHINRGDITTLGELMYFFRGKNEKQILLDDVHYAYLQRTLPTSSTALPPSTDDTPTKTTTKTTTTTTTTTTANTNTTIKSDKDISASPHAVCLLQRLTRCAAQAARLQAERATPFNPASPADNKLLRELWEAAGLAPDDFAPSSPAWAALGFQGLNPTTDLRGGGILALRQLVHFAQTHNDAFKEMMAFNKKALDEGEHHWYLLAVVSIHFTTQLILQQDYKMDLPQLEVLYDTVIKQEKVEEKDSDGVVSSDQAGKESTTAMEQSTSQSNEENKSNDNIENEKKTSSSSSSRICEQESDFEEGFFTLHHQLLLHFKNCWHRDLPHVMEYNNYIPSVYESFVSESARCLNAEESTKDTS